MDAGDISPFMVLVSPTKRCGKTTVLIILYYLTPKSELASNISPSAVFRYIEEVRPTLLIDEADTFVKDNEELRGILNSGHTKAAAHVIRNVEINGEHRSRRFSTWAPKAIATIRALADTLQDRAVVLTLQRKPRGAPVERLRKRDNPEFAVLRRKAARWAADNFSVLEDPDPEIPTVLNDRAADNWRPLMAIADLAGGDWPVRVRETACILSGDGHDTDAINVELLGDIEKAFDDLDVITSADLVAALVADPERPWATWGKNDKPLTQNQLARLLRPFGIISETVHPFGRPHAKGYKRPRLEEVWAPYLGQNPSQHASDPSKACNRANADEMGITRIFQGVQEQSPHASKNGNLSYSHAGLHACTVRNMKSEDEGDSATTWGKEEPGHWGANGEPAVCAQCDDGSEPLYTCTTAEGVVPLHQECLRFWLQRHPQPKGALITCVCIEAVPSPAIAASEDIEDILEDRWRQ
jgi:putative DNA primase/helicase